MKISFAPQKFKGYDAAPIKNLYMGGIEDEINEDIFNDLKDVTCREKIGLYCTSEKRISEKPLTSIFHKKRWTPWSQDIWLFEKDGKDKKVRPTSFFRITNELKKDFASLGVSVDKKIADIEGGNFFLGKKENGEEYILVGEKDFKEAKKLAKVKGIKEENVYTAPQGAFHIDLIMRPIGYPYILVNDEDIVFENVNKLRLRDDEKEKIKAEISKDMLIIRENAKLQPSGKEIAKKLEKQGFKPILIGGNYYQDVNFMNAIVHKRNDGSLVYITNSSENINNIASEFQKTFEQELREKVPNIAKIDFILGKEARNQKENCIQTFLQLGGGIHCLTAEEPDFDCWT